MVSFICQDKQGFSVVAVAISLRLKWLSFHQMIHCTYIFYTTDKFLPFKTMLDSRYDDQIPEECRFDVDMLFLSAKAKKVIKFVYISLYLLFGNNNRKLRCMHLENIQDCLDI